MTEKAHNLFDETIRRIDRGIRTLAGVRAGARENPADSIDEPHLDDQQRTHAAGLMRVNHTGEICAQALYEGQALTARDRAVRDRFLESADEEADHLAWCAERLEELESTPSLLNPVFYAASYAMGAVTGLLGDKLSLGFVEATEDQVCKHLEHHLDALPAEDAKSRAIVGRMREEEARHGSAALEMGGTTFPEPVKQAMTLLSRVMTETTYRF